MATKYSIIWSWNRQEVRKDLNKQEALDWIADHLYWGGTPGAFDIVEIQYEESEYVPEVNELADAMDRMKAKYES